MQKFQLYKPIIYLIMDPRSETYVISDIYQTFVCISQPIKFYKTNSNSICELDLLLDKSLIPDH
jgi:hypothetical protein